MHREFGALEGKLCKECGNLVSRRWNGRTYYKCSVYGDSASEATDWRIKNTACGMFDKDCGDLEMVRAVRPGKEKVEPLIGQIGFDD